MGRESVRLAGAGSPWQPPLVATLQNTIHEGSDALVHANNPGDAQFDPELVEALRRDLFNIYETAGREVTYVTPKGERRPYWANRFRQALQRAVNAREVVEFVEILMLRSEPSRGFFYLKDAGRLDVAVEALVVDQTKAYHSLFSHEAVRAARDRLAEHTGQSTAPPPPPPPASTATGPPLTPGSSVDIRVTVGPKGELTLALI
jgi:hypothetical protein